MIKKRYACYCSGNAGRIIKFYKRYNFNDFPLQFVFYDGISMNIFAKLSQIDSRLEVIHYENSNSLKGKLLSQEISDRILMNLDKHKIDYMFCFGSKILKSPLIVEYKNRIINFHPSLLPAFPGLKPIDQALAHGVKVLGNTAHFVDAGIDTGKIIEQTVIHIDEYHEYEDVLKLQIDMLRDIWQRFDKIK
jgi:phosphoribosylglycinamide formyltransferase-1